MNHLTHTTTPTERRALLSGALADGVDVTEDHEPCSRVEYPGDVVLYVHHESRTDRPDRLDARFAVLRGRDVVWTGERLCECVRVLEGELG